MFGGQASLLADATDLAQQVSSLSDSITGQGSQPAGGPASAHPREPVWAAMNRTEYLDALRDVAAWVTGVLFRRYPATAAVLPPCWPAHSAVVEELDWLYWDWTCWALDPDARSRDAADWHDRWLPGVLARIRPQLAAAAVVTPRSRSDLPAVPGTVTAAMSLANRGEGESEGQSARGPRRACEQPVTWDYVHLSRVPTACAVARTSASAVGQRPRLPACIVGADWASGHVWSWRGGYDVVMVSGHARAYDARPGRRAVVATDLADLRGPRSGIVELPLRLFWSLPGHRFDLTDPDMRLWLYQTVLREAVSPEDLIAYLDRDLLVELWPELYLPRGVRLAWQDRYPELRAPAAA